MAMKKVFSKFLGTVLEGMEKTVAGKSLTGCEKVAFEWKWKKLGHVGATGVAEHLQEKHGLKASPTVVDGGEEPKNPVFSVSHEKFTHAFEVEETRFRYLRVNGKAEEKLKEFSALKTEFWVEFERKKGNIDKRGKAKKTKTREDASYEISLQLQKDKKEAKKREEEEAARKKEEDEAAKTIVEMPPATPPPPVNGEAASGEPLSEE